MPLLASLSHSGIASMTKSSARRTSLRPAPAPTPSWRPPCSPSSRQPQAAASAQLLHLGPSAAHAAAAAAAAALLLACSPAPALAAGMTVMTPIHAAMHSQLGLGQGQGQGQGPLLLVSAAPAPAAAASEEFPPFAQQRRVFVSFARQVVSLTDMGYTYVDVRSPEAYAAGHVPGSVNIPYSPKLAQEVEARFSRTDPIVIGCKAGKFSAHSMLLLTGFNAVEYRGGFDDWTAAGMKVDK